MKKILKIVVRLFAVFWIIRTVLSFYVPEIFLNVDSTVETQLQTNVTETVESPKPTEPEIIEVIDPSRPNYNLGRCANLCSDVQVVAVFLDDQEAKWSPAEAVAFTENAIQPGLDFIREQAQHYGVSISLDVVSIYTDGSRSLRFDGIFGSNFTTDDSGNIQYGQTITWEESTVVGTVWEQLKFDSVEQMHISMQQTYGREQIAYLIIPKKAGRSYALPDHAANGFSAYEHAVVYPMDEYGNSNGYDMVARYLLNLFGAGFSVESWEGRESTYSVAVRMYPYSVMFQGNRQCYTVDPYTAYAVGWRNVIPTENNQLDLSGGYPQLGDPYRPMFDKGTCRNLAGRVSLLTIFLDDYETQWTQEEIDWMYQDKINPAVSFMVDQAQQWDIWLEFDTHYYATDAAIERQVQYQGVLDEYGFQNHFPDVLDQTAMSIGFPSKQDMYNNVLEQSGADHLIIMIALNSTGRSYAVTDQDDNPNHNVEYFVLYRNHWKTRNETAASTVAHEMLHLYGAEDMYQEPDSELRAQRAAIANSYFPKDIMYKEFLDIWKNVIDDYTAYAIGWNDVIPQACTSDAFWEP